MEWIAGSAVIICGYLFGSIPTGYLVGRARGVDIRQLGSGNIGATNVFRSLGKGWGLLVFIGDAFKGFFACWFAAPMVYWLFMGRTASVPETLLILTGAVAILGNIYPIWLGFRGGKGIASAAGVYLALAPLAITLSIILWAVVLSLSRMVSLGSILAAASLPVFIWLCGGSGLLIGLTAGLSCLAIYRHRANIQRILKGTEHRFGQETKP